MMYVPVVFLRLSSVCNSYIASMIVDTHSHTARIRGSRADYAQMHPHPRGTSIYTTHEATCPRANVTHMI